MLLSLLVVINDAEFIMQKSWLEAEWSEGKFLTFRGGEEWNTIFTCVAEINNF